jgi:hypothetical protein
MYTPKPPCFLSKTFTYFFEFSIFCVGIGKVGTQYFDDNRKPIMLFATFITFVCAILSIVALIAVSNVDALVRSTCWTYGKGDGGVEIFIGLNKIIIDNPNGISVSALWGDSSCDNIEAAGVDLTFCTECRDSCDASVIVAIMSLVTILPTITTDIQRSTRKGDLNCQKFMGVVTGVLSLMSTIAALSAYAGGCYKNLPSNFNGKEIDYNYGPGFLCLFFATVLKVVDIVANLFLPVSPYVPGEEADYVCAMPDPPGVQYPGPSRDNVGAGEVEMAVRIPAAVASVSPATATEIVDVEAAAVK